MSGVGLQSRPVCADCGACDGRKLRPICASHDDEGRCAVCGVWLVQADEILARDPRNLVPAMTLALGGLGR